MQYAAARRQPNERLPNVLRNIPSLTTGSMWCLSLNLSEVKPAMFSTARLPSTSGTLAGLLLQRGPVRGEPSLASSKLLTPQAASLCSPAAGRAPVAWVRTLHAEPGSLSEKGHIESHMAKLRDGLLDRETFYALFEANVLAGPWRRQCDEARPRSSLGCGPPAPEAVALFSPSFGTLRQGNG